MVGIKSLETFSSEFLIDTSFLDFSKSRFVLFSFGLLSKMAEIEMSENSVGKSIEFFLINLSWGLRVNSLSCLLDPSPLFFSDGVVLGFGELLKSSLDFFV